MVYTGDVILLILNCKLIMRIVFDACEFIDTIFPSISSASHMAFPVRGYALSPSLDIFEDSTSRPGLLIIMAGLIVLPTHSSVGLVC